MSSGVPRKIQISPVMNGYHVAVGCQSLVFNSPDVLLKELGRYLDRPDEVEKEYMDGALHRCVMLDPATPTEGCGQMAAPTQERTVENRAPGLRR